MSNTKTSAPGFFSRVISTDASKWVVLIRLATGAVFLSEGIQKFLFPATIGAGRFLKIGIPSPEIMGPFVGTMEIVCGILLLIGLLTRFAAVPLMAVMLVAISTTKVPMLLKQGFWTMAHESRTDYAMILGCLFLALVGAGKWSVDAALQGRSPTGR